MPTDIWSIPLDSDGAVRGSYYLRHASEVTDTLGVVPFVRGRSVEPITGKPLVHIVAALGIDLDLEPADDEAREALGVAAPAARPEPVAAVEPDEPTTEPDIEPPAEQLADDQPRHKPKHGKR